MTKPTALDTYLQRLPMILDKIKALRQLAIDHVGDLGRRLVEWQKTGHCCLIFA